MCLFMLLSELKSKMNERGQWSELPSGHCVLIKEEFQNEVNVVKVTDRESRTALRIIGTTMDCMSFTMLVFWILIVLFY